MSLILIGLLFLAAIALVIFLWWRERRYLRRKTSETMSDETWGEILEEREIALRKRRLFKQALDQALKK